MKETELSKVWRERFQEWQESGKSIARWCKDHDLPDHQFYYWKNRLNGQKRKRSTLPPEEKFIELEDAGQSGSGIAIHVSGVELHLSEEFDKTTLRRCLQVLGRDV